MNRLVASLAGVVVAFATFVAFMQMPSIARAQLAGDTTGRITSGSIPQDGGFGLVVYGGGTFEQLSLASACPASRVAFWFTVNGEFVVYVPGTSIAIVNAAARAAFPGDIIPVGTALIGRCTPAGQVPIATPVTTPVATPIATPVVTPVATPTGRAGVAGTVTRGPMCAVQSGGASCADQPYAGAVVIALGGDMVCAGFTCGQVEAGRATSAADGTYRIVLAAGTYSVVAQGQGATTGGFPAPPASVTAVVPPDTFVTVNLRFDTGLR